MCLLISVEVPRGEENRFTNAVALASNGIKLELTRPISGSSCDLVALVLTEEGGCSCSLLADDADWNAATWSFRSEIVQPLLGALQALLRHGPNVLRIGAMWAGERPKHVDHLSAEAFLARFQTEGLGTRTLYVVTPSSAQAD